MEKAYVSNREIFLLAADDFVNFWRKDSNYSKIFPILFVMINKRRIQAVIIGTFSRH